MCSFFGEQGRQAQGSGGQVEKEKDYTHRLTGNPEILRHLLPPDTPALPGPSRPQHTAFPPKPRPSGPCSNPAPTSPLPPPSSPLSPCHQVPVPPDREAELLCLPSSSQAGRSGLVMNPSGRRNPPSAGRSLGREHTRSARAVLGNTVTRGCAHCLTNPDSVSHRAVSASHCRLRRDGAGPSLNIPKFNLFEHSVFAVQHRKSKSNKLHLGKYR